MTTCDIACQTDKVRISYYDEVAQKKYRDKIKEQNGKYYTPKQEEYMKTYRAKLNLKKQKEQNLLKIEIKT